jgi:hypothetical protein
LELEGFRSGRAENRFVRERRIEEPMMEVVRSKQSGIRMERKFGIRSCLFELWQEIPVMVD